MQKKLSLSTETLRVLADEELVAVKGARKTGGKAGGGRCRATAKTGTGKCQRTRR